MFSPSKSQKNKKSRLSFYRKLEEYKRKKRLLKENVCKKKPIFKFYHVTDNVFLNVNETRNTKKYKRKDPYAHVKAKVDSGLKRRIKPIPDAALSHEIKQEMRPSKTPQARKKRNNEIISLLNDQNISYNLRKTPARISFKEKLHKDESLIRHKLDKNNSITLKQYKHDTTIAPNPKLTNNAFDPTSIKDFNTPYPKAGSLVQQITWFMRIYEHYLSCFEICSTEWRNYIKSQSENNFNHEIEDLIRTHVGKLNLFKNGRFKQFGSLAISAYDHLDDSTQQQQQNDVRKRKSIIHNDSQNKSKNSKNMQKIDETKIPKALDLVGFWEMILPQVNEICKENELLILQKNNGWLPVSNDTVQLCIKKYEQIKLIQTPQKSVRDPTITKKTPKQPSNVNKRTLKNVSTDDPFALPKTDKGNVKEPVVKKRLNFAEWKKTNNIKTSPPLSDVLDEKRDYIDVNKLNPDTCKMDEIQSDNKENVNPIEMENLILFSRAHSNDKQSEQAFPSWIPSPIKSANSPTIFLLHQNRPLSKSPYTRKSQRLHRTPKIALNDSILEDSSLIVNSNQKNLEGFNSSPYPQSTSDKKSNKRNSVRRRKSNSTSPITPNELNNATHAVDDKDTHFNKYRSPLPDIREENIDELSKVFSPLSTTPNTQNRYQLREPQITPKSASRINKKNQEFLAENMEYTSLLLESFAEQNNKFTPVSKELLRSQRRSARISFLAQKLQNLPSIMETSPS